MYLTDDRMVVCECLAGQRRREYLALTPEERRQKLLAERRKARKQHKQKRKNESEPKPEREQEEIPF